MREAIVSMSDAELEAMGMGDVVSYVRDAGVRDLEELDCHGRGGLLQLEVESELDGDRLSSFEAVDRWEFVTEREETYLYFVRVTAPDLSEDVADPAGDLVGTCDPTMTDRGATVELVGDQGAISETLREYEKAGVSPELDRLGDYEGEDGALDALTDRQREVVETAYEMGFYDVPREVSTEAIAAELGVDSSTVAEHLQRAERNLLGEQLAGE
jgi:DNA-binding CsgD family transcriptional regulator